MVDNILLKIQEIQDTVDTIADCKVNIHLYSKKKKIYSLFYIKNKFIYS